MVAVQKLGQSLLCAELSRSRILFEKRFGAGQVAASFPLIRFAPPLA